MWSSILQCLSVYHLILPLSAPTSINHLCNFLSLQCFGIQSIRCCYLCLTCLSNVLSFQTVLYYLVLYRSIRLSLAISISSISEYSSSSIIVRSVGPSLLLAVTLIHWVWFLLWRLRFHLSFYSLTVSLSILRLSTGYPGRSRPMSSSMFALSSNVGSKLIPLLGTLSTTLFSSSRRPTIPAVQLSLY